MKIVTGLNEAGKSIGNVSGSVQNVSVTNTAVCSNKKCVYVFYVAVQIGKENDP